MVPPATAAALLWALLALAGPSHAARALAPAPEVSNTGTTSDVIVIGAGMAGISLGRALADNSTARIIILEARDRSGGRLCSIETPYGRVDTGAMWIHNGLPGNPLYDLAVSLGAELSPPEDYFSAATFTADGRPTAVGSLDPALYTAWISDMLGGIDSMRAAEAAAAEAATKSTVEDESINDVYQRFVAKNNVTERGLLPNTNLMAHTAYQVLLNGNLTALSALRYGDAKTLPAVDVLLTEGFDHLTDLLKSGLDIRYETPVAAVAQGRDGVAITAADGTIFRAKYAVSTLPLGVMKAEAVRFDPPLPPPQAAAVEAMGFGVFDKVILVWDVPFWSASDFISREMPDLSGEWAIFLNNNRTLGVPALVALNVADTARRLEARPDGEVVADVLGVLRSMYGAAAVPDPVQAHVTHWAADPWTRGAYSYYAVGNPLNVTTALAQPHGRVLFAGEATSDNPATVLGAYESGRREAARLAGLLAGAAA